jgi:hypothetical protein
MRITQGFHGGMLDHNHNGSRASPINRTEGSEAKIGFLRDKTVEVRVDAPQRARGLRIARLLGRLCFIALDRYGGAHIRLRYDLLS